MRKVWVWLLLLSSMACAAPVLALQTVLVVLSDNTAPYRAVLQALDSGLLPPLYAIRVVSAQAVDGAVEQASRPDLVITLGVQAAESVDRLPAHVPVLAALVPRDWYAAGGQAFLSKRRDVTVLFIDQPLRRQLRLIREVLPQARVVGVVVSQQRAWLLPQLQSEARSFGLTLNAAVVGPQLGLVAALDKTLADSDVLLALPDPDVFNSATAQTVFLTTYRYREPVVGYSASMTKAGALVSVYSTPAQIGEQTAELAARILAADGKALPPQFPADYSVAVNEYVARSLGIQLPPQDAMKKSLAEEPFND